MVIVHTYLCHVLNTAKEFLAVAFLLGNIAFWKANITDCFLPKLMLFHHDVIFII